MQRRPALKLPRQISILLSNHFSTSGNTCKGSVDQQTSIINILAPAQPTCKHVT